MKNKKLYLELIKKTLTFSFWPDPPVPIDLFNDIRPTLKRNLVMIITNFLDLWNYKLVKSMKYTPLEKYDGKIWPLYAHTMVGRKRLDNLQYCIEEVLDNNIKGDFIEAGVWRGGTGIL